MTGPTINSGQTNKIGKKNWEGDDGEDDENPDSAFLIVDDQALVAVDKNPLYRGCLVVDTGCSCSVSSLKAAKLTQLDRLAEEGDIWSECLPPNKTFLGLRTANVTNTTAM